MVALELAGAGGARLRADVSGPEDGPPVVLLHGGGQTRHSWGVTAKALAAQGWRAFNTDLRGHGESEWVRDGDYSIDAFAADVTAMADAMATPPVLVGASLGGLASLIAVGQSAGRPGPPLARALVLVDVAPTLEQAGVDRIHDFMLDRLEEGFADLDEVADAVAAYNPHRPRPKDISGLQRNVRRREDGRLVWHWDPRFLASESTGDRAPFHDPGVLEDCARAVRIPTLLVRGRVSDLLSEEGAQQLLRLVPHAVYVNVEGAGHMVAGDRNDLFNDAVVSFLAGLP